MGHGHSILPPPPDSAELEVGALREKQAARRLSRSPSPAPANQQTNERAELMAEVYASAQARGDRERYFRRVVQRDVELVAAGWSFDDIDAANDQRRPALSTRQLRRAAEATTVRPK